MSPSTVGTKAVVFDGVRAKESLQRASYSDISIGAKNINQILFNDAYRRGLFRVGCTVCPMSSNWWETIVNDVYPAEIQPLLSKVEQYARATKSESEVAKFIEQGGWKARMGGRGLPNGGNRIVKKLSTMKLLSASLL